MRRALLEQLEQRQLLAVTSIQAFDDVAPVIAAFQAPTVTNDNRLAIAIRTPHPSGLADISVLRNDGSGLAVQQFENVPTDAAGIARISTPALADGDYLIRARAGLYAKYFFICEPGLAAFEAEGSLTFRVDTIRPAAAVSTTVRGPTNSSDPIPFSVTFTEPVTGFQASDAIVVNGAIQRMVANSPTSFTLFVRPLAAGNVSLRIPAAVAADAAFNPNTASNLISVVFDRTAPALVSVTRQPVSNGITNADSLVFRATFSEAVANVDAADFVAVGTTAGVSRVVQVGPRVFDVTLTGGNLAGINGAVKIAVRPGNNITDAAGTALSTRAPAPDQRYFLDNTAPTVRIVAAVAATSNASSIPVTIRFSEPVTGFALSDLALTNATASGFAGSGAAYTFNLAPRADGRVAVQVPAGVAFDAAGNRNAAAVPLSFVSDRTRPTVRISTSEAGPTNAAAIPILAQFSEAVSGFTASDITVTNGTISGFTGSGALYRFNVVPLANGRVTVAIAPTVATDVAGNANFASNGLAIVSDTTAPTVAVTSPSASPTNSSAIPFRITFSQAVTGFAATDPIIINGTITGFTGEGNTYRFQVIPTADGPVTVRLPAGAAQDPAGNNSLASGTVSIRSDRTPPAVDVASSLTSPTNADVIPFRIAFSEPVIGFAQTDIQLANGGIMDFTANADGSYTVNVAPNGDGQVQLTVPAGAAQDAAGNGNAAGSFAVASDRTAPRATLTYNPPPDGSFNLGTVTITFTEPVTGFDISDLRLQFPEAQFPLTAAMLTGSGANYVLDLTTIPLQPGEHELTLTAAGSEIFDLAGNALLLDANTTWIPSFSNP